MKVESTKILEEIERQKKKGENLDFIHTAFNYGLNMAKIIIEGEEKLEKLKEDRMFDDEKELTYEQEALLEDQAEERRMEKKEARNV